MRKNSIKNIRINGEVQRVVAEAIRYSKDPRISPMTSVMEVEVAPDLKTCKIWVTVLGGDHERARTMEGLKSATGYIRSTLAKEINLRNTPALQFIMDDSIEYAINMSKKIDEVTAKDDKSRAERKDGDEADGGETDGDEADGGEADGDEADGNVSDGDEADGGEADGGEADGETTGGNE